jgi:hypothetical protein
VTLATEVRAKRPRSANLAGKPSLSWHRLRNSCSARCCSPRLLTFYQQLVVRVSRDAVINARLAVIRAPIDGVATASVTTPGSAMKAGEAGGRVEDLLADDARPAQLLREVSATARIDEARANLAAAAAREADAKAAAGRGAALHARGFQSDEAQDKARHAQEVEEQGAIAARKRLDTLGVELDAARSGTFLGDSYNDAPSSLQRARELLLRITESPWSPMAVEAWALIFKNIAN